MDTCANPGCVLPGTKQCSACKITPYCGSICQTANWPTHKESCPGQVRKLGMGHLTKAQGFFDQKNWPQCLRYSDLALAKLKKLKDLPIEAINDVLTGKCIALNGLNRYRDALECAKERYCLTHLTNYTHPHAIEASFRLIELCIVNGEYFDAELYARVLWETLTLSKNISITDDQLQLYIARAAHELAKTSTMLAKKGGIKQEKLQAAGKEAMTLARKALEMKTQQHGLEHVEVATSMNTLSDVLSFFNEVGDDEIPRLLEQSIAIYARLQGRISANVAAGEFFLATVYHERAKRAEFGDFMEKHATNWELSLPHYREASRIYRALNYVEKADSVAREADSVEEILQNLAIIRSAAKIR